jgi:hypothetical protein
VKQFLTFLDSYLRQVKGTLTRDFRHLLTVGRVKAFLNMASNSRRKSTKKSTIFVSESYRDSVGQFAYVCFFR